MSEFIIKNGLVHRGDGSEPRETDILVKGETIAELLRAKKGDSRNLIDAKGMTVTPGFIEVNFEAGKKNGIFDDRYSTALVRRGVTSAIDGSSGISLAPLFAKSIPFLRSMAYSPLTVDWQSVGEFLSVLKKRGVGVNFGTLVGYGTLRNAFAEGYGRDLTVGEMESIGRIAAKSFKEGAFGISFDLSEPYLEGVPTNEIARVINTIDRPKEIFAFHLRDEREALKSTAEVLSILGPRSLNVEINHFQPVRGFGEGYRAAASRMEKDAAEQNIHFDVFPEPVVMMPIHDFFPSWIKEKTLCELARAAKESHVKDRLLAELSGLDFESLTIALAPNPLHFLEGRRIKDFAATRNITSEEAMLELAHLTKMQAELFCSCVDRDVLGELLKSSHSLLSLSYHGESGGDDSLFGDILSSEKFVEKITGLAAKKYGIQKRGLVKEGYFADLVVFKDKKPHYVFVNGRMVMDAGILKPQFAGHVLKNDSGK